MTPGQALIRLRNILADHKAGKIDTEESHREADDVLCELLKELGLNDVVEAWDAIPMWYS